MCLIFCKSIELFVNQKIVMLIIIIGLERAQKDPFYQLHLKRGRSPGFAGTSAFGG
jgi:hypothetical protein